MIITSASNQKVKDIKKLIKSAAYRRDMGLYVVEGIRMFRELRNESVEAVYIAEGVYEKLKSEVLNVVDESKLIYVKDNVFASMSDTNAPQGLMATVKIQTNSIEDIVKCEKSFILIAERLQDPGNLGTILRTAEAAGATGIMLSADSVDMYNPKVIRSTMGSCFRVPVYVSADLGADIELLKKKGIVIYGAHLNGNEFYDEDFRGSCGFLIGNEGNGLSDDISGKADKLIKIPMCGKVESLNAATSVAVISYEVMRQRR